MKKYTFSRFTSYVIIFSLFIIHCSLFVVSSVASPPPPKAVFIYDPATNTYTPVIPGAIFTFSNGVSIGDGTGATPIDMSYDSATDTLTLGVGTVSGEKLSGSTSVSAGPDGLLLQNTYVVPPINGTDGLFFKGGVLYQRNSGVIKRVVDGVTYGTIKICYNFPDENASSNFITDYTTYFAEHTESPTVSTKTIVVATGLVDTRFNNKNVLKISNSQAAGTAQYKSAYTSVKSALTKTNHFYFHGWIYTPAPTDGRGDGYRNVTGFAEAANYTETKYFLVGPYSDTEIGMLQESGNAHTAVSAGIHLYDTWNYWELLVADTTPVLLINGETQTLTGETLSNPDGWAGAYAVINEWAGFFANAASQDTYYKDFDILEVTP